MTVGAIKRSCLQASSGMGHGATSARPAGNHLGLAMAKTRRYSIEMKDTKSKTVLVSAAVDWTSDEKQVALAQILRLLGQADRNGPTRRLSQQRAAQRHATIAAKRTSRGRQ